MAPTNSKSNFKDSELYQVLRTFGPADRRKFRLFLASPYHNNKPQLLTFYEHILRFAPKFSSNDLDDHKLLHDSDLDITNKKNLYNLKSEICHLAEVYLTLEENNKDPFGDLSRLAGIHKNRNLRVRYSRIMKKADPKVQDHLVGNGAEQALRRFTYNKILLDDIYLTASRKSVDNRLISMVEDLDEFYLHMKLRYSCELKNRELFYNEDYPNQMLDVILPEIVASENPTIQIYQKILALLNKDLEMEDRFDVFQEYLDLLPEQQDRLSGHEYKSIIDYGLNFCIRYSNAVGDLKGPENFVRLIENLEERELLVEHQIIKPFQFRSTVNCYLDLGKAEKARSFMDRYGEFIPEGQRKNVLDQCNADYFFATERFDEVFSIVQQVSYLDPKQVVALKVVEIKCDIAMAQWDRLTNDLDAFRHYIKHYEEQISYKDRLEAFLDVARKIGRLRKEDTEAWQEIMNRTTINPRPVHWRWLRSYVGQHLNVPQN